MTTSVIDPRPNLDRIHPYKVLRFIVPGSIELLLTDGTGTVSKNGVCGDGDVFVLWVILGSGCSYGGGGGFW